MKSDVLIFGSLLFVAIVGIIMGASSVDSADLTYSYRVDGMADPVSNSYFAETGWRPVEDWEIERCSRKLSSDLTGEISNGNSFSSQNFAYGTTATLQATIKDNYGDYYHELAWYLQPTTEDITFSLTVYDENDVGKVIIEPTEMAQFEGRGFYHAFIDVKKYERAELNFGEGTLKVNFVKKEE
ncbi:hypothetical protein JXA48_01255 [Candidatus Woesearchaeota archaeon]|nr:hypothetical protein [Candidatus Woesearchaeota archaeon]